MIENLANIMQKKRNTNPDSRVLDLNSFSQVSYTHPLMINNNLKNPLMLSRNDLKSGVFLDGFTGFGVNTVGHILLTQLISQDGGAICFVDLSIDCISARMIYSSASLYSRENDIVIITRNDIKDIEVDYLKSLIVQNKIIIVGNSGNVCIEDNEICSSYHLLLSKIIDASMIEFKPNKKPPFTVYIETSFLLNQNLLNIASWFEDEIKNSAWGWILVNTQKNIAESDLALSCANHMYFHSDIEDSKSKRSELAVGQFYFYMDGMPTSDKPHFGRFVTVEDKVIPDSICSLLGVEN